MFMKSNFLFRLHGCCAILVSGVAVTSERSTAPRPVVLSSSGSLSEVEAVGETGPPAKLNKVHPPGRHHEHERHKVEHVELLNNAGFWWLMGALIFMIAVAVMGIDADNARPGEKSALAASSSGRTPQTSPGQSSRELTYGNVAHLGFCVVSLYISMLAWGVAQEFVMTNAYGPDPDTAETLPSVSFLVFCNRGIAAMFSMILIVSQGKTLAFQGFTHAASPAVTNLVASWCQYRSLEYISFALQTTAKSAKLLPVVIIGSLRGKRTTLLDYAETLVIMSGLVVFGLETEADAQDFQTTSMGILLLCGLIIADAATPHLQDSLFLQYPDLDVIQAQFAMSAVACGFLFVMELATGSLQVMILFLQRHPEAILHIVVLSLSSTLTQYLISYSIKHYGPVTVVLVTSTRQLVAICLSAVLFEHTVTPLAGVAAVLIFGMVIVRALRPRHKPRPQGMINVASTQSITGDLSEAAGAVSYPWLKAIFGEVPLSQNSYAKFLLCIVAIHIIYCLYAVEQEFLAYHTFNGKVFAFPLFIVAMNHCCGAVVSYMLLWSQGIPINSLRLRYAVLPALPNLVATAFQYAALYSLLFPAQTIMKTLKVVPVMLVGRLCGTRKYSWLDYGEGLLISALVTYFVLDFQPDFHAASQDSMTAATTSVLFMVGYVVVDSFTSNLEDYVYQITNMDPVRLLFGMESVSGLLALLLVIIGQELQPALEFLYENHEILPYIFLLAITSATGFYTCTLTVRLFGPAVFTLLMVSRQIVSLVISVHVFQHNIDSLECACLVVVCCLVLTVSLRRVTAQDTLAFEREEPQKAGP